MNPDPKTILTEYDSPESKERNSCECYRCGGPNMRKQAPDGRVYWVCRFCGYISHDFLMGEGE